MTDSAALEDAALRAWRLYPKHKGLRTAYRNGAAAALAGRSIDTCPYAVDRFKTWRRAFRIAWLGGYRSILPEADEE